MKKIIKEPLSHFLIIGFGLFLLYSLVNKRHGKNEIVIDQYVINDLSAKWNMQWYREPNLAELKKLIKLYVDQEVLYREALAMNLDHNDEIIKRRLAKKMEFISDEMAASLQPSEKILKAYYIKHNDDYAKPPVYTFTQVYFSSQKRKTPREDAVELLKVGNPAESGDALSIARQYTNVDGLKIAIDFGNAFAQALDTIAVGKWSGPIRSGYGIHLVFIKNKQSSGVYTYEEVAEKVNMDYNFHASNDFKKELITALLKDYKISFELNDTNLKEELVESF